MATTLKNKTIGEHKKIRTATGVAKTPDDGVSKAPTKANKSSLVYSALVMIDSKTGKLIEDSVKLLERLSTPTKYFKVFYQFTGQGFTILLRYPAQCQIEELSDGVMISYLPLNIHNFGKNEKEAMQGVAEGIEHIYSHNQQQNDDNQLTEYAKQIKYLTLSLVKEIVYGKS